MADQFSQRAIPVSAVAALGTLIIGLVVARGGPTDPPKADLAGALAAGDPSGSGVARPPPGDRGADRDAVLRPFREALFGEGTARGKGPGQIAGHLRGSPRVAVGSFIATVPDPVETTLSFRFDETVDSIERALGTNNYILERWRLPWAESGSSAAPDDGFVGDVRKIASDLAKSPPTRQSASHSRPHPTPGDPGLLVFRKQPKPARAKGDGADAGKPGGKPAEALTELVLVYLITETPTQGVDRLALSLSLDLAEEHHNLGACPDDAEGPRAIQVLGPCFSGSMPSLRDSLLDWLDRRDGKTPAYRFDVVSGSASAFDKRGFEGAFEGRNADLAGGNKVVATAGFSSMVHHTEAILKTILKFLGRSDDSEDVAILSEINTGFGEAVSDDRAKPRTKLKYPKSSLLGLQYPLHIAEIRERYQSQGLLQDVSTDVFKAAGELRGRGDSKGKVRDVLPDQTSETTAIAENRVLTQTLRYLEDSRFKYIGIISTDPNDTVFLARLIRRYCPDARVFTVSSDLIYLDSESISDLRGMIVGSTYPLYAPNHSWSGSDESSRGHVFSSEYAQGIFNAAVLQTARLAGSDERKGLLEYAMPRSLQPRPAPGRAAKFFDPWQPPVWISVVGERSLYPVDCRWPFLDEPELARLEDYLARPRPSTCPPPSGPSTLKINRFSAWIVSFGATSLLLLLAQANRILSARRARGGVAGAGDLAARPPSRPEAIDGSLLAILVRSCIFAGYLYVSCPLLATLGGSPVVELNLDNIRFPVPFRLGLYLVLLLVVVAVVLAPLLERTLAARRRASALLEAAAMALLLEAAAIGVIAAQPGGAWWPLSLDRSSAITGGVSAYVPAWFLMVALGSWLYLRRQIREINDDLALRTTPGVPTCPTEPVPIGGYDELLRSIRVHRESFEAWFEGGRGGTLDELARPLAQVRDYLGRESWKARWPWIAMAALLVGSFVDAAWFRPPEGSDEGRGFDFLFRFAFGVILSLFAWNFARLASAWSDLRAVLAGFSKILDGAFQRIPRGVSAWFFDPVACKGEYRLLILRQIYAIRALLDRRPAVPDPSGPKFPRGDDEVRERLAALEAAQADRTDGSHPEIESIRAFALDLAGYWAALPVGQAAPPPEKDKDKEKDKAAPSIDEQLIGRLEELLALHATRWIGGALGRIWTLIGFLVLSSLAMLFAITSYPFPEQPRLMTVIGLGIAGLLVLIVRVVIGTNRDRVVSRVGDTTPGRISWDASLFAHLGAFVIPLVGVLAAISFDVLDLFRAVLGPILRLFP